MLIVPGEETLPVADARCGDPDAWSALFRRFRLPLYAYVIELVRHEQTAMDIVQETFINATRHIASLREDGRFGSWLFSIAHQKCRQHWRKPQHESVEIDDQLHEFDSDADGPRELLIRQEEEGEFMKLLQSLSEAHRSVVLLHYLEDFSLEEIAEIAGISVGTVKSRLHYAKKQLRELLEENR
jgi:RNA polymerase sigma-70 factor, ECF subfamily